MKRPALERSPGSLADQSGVTVTELLVVCVVICIVAAFALIQRGSANEQLKRQNAAQALKGALERARFDSVKRRADTNATQAKVVVDHTSFTLITDKNQDGTLDYSDEQVTNLPVGIVLDGNRYFSLPATVVFNQRGEATATASNLPISPVFYVCNLECGTTTNANANLLLVTATGTVNLLPGGASAPNFAPPSGVSAVPANTGVNPDVVLQ